MEITVQDINKLRQLTGAGMMDCKKALTEANGDFEIAVDILRKKGQKVSAARSDKEAKEGVVFIKLNANSSEAVIFKMNCETDFVARNDEFVKLGETIAQTAMESKIAVLDDLKNASIAGRKVSDHITDLIGKIGEKIEIGDYHLVKSDLLVPYIHQGSKLGVLVALKNATMSNATEVGKDIAMQIASMSPIAVDKTDLDTKTIEKELEIAKEQVRAEGKPENMVEKIATGKLNKFYKESTLLNQDFIKDSSKTVGQFINEVAKGLVVSSFKRISV